MSTTVINTIGNENKKKQFLEKIALGEITVSFAYQEKSNFDPYFINTIAKSDGDNYIINGEKFYVLDANISDYIIAFNSNKLDIKIPKKKTLEELIKERDEMDKNTKLYKQSETLRYSQS